jgi:soluble lytic murein transglycosylase-like protein
MRPKGPAGTGDWAPRHGKMPPDGLGWGRGLMQADYAASAFAKDATEWTDPRQNIEFGCNELATDLQHYKTRFADLPAEKQLQAAIASYNTGPGNVDRSLNKGRDVDSTTAGHDYSADVLSRAAWFKAKGFDDHIATT